MVLILLSLGGFMVKNTSERIKITIWSFVRQFSGDSRNTVLTLMVATNVCVIGVIVATNVKRPIEQMGSRPEGHSATTRIHD
jgi:hypothetical protein